MEPRVIDVKSTGAPVPGQFLSVFPLFDVLGQVVLSIIAFAPAEAGLQESSGEMAIYRLPIVIWQSLSLIANAVANEGTPGYRVHTIAFWPFVLSLLAGILLTPVTVGYTILWAWYAVVQLLSLPYLVLSVVVLCRSVAKTSRPKQRRVPVATLFRIQQADLLAQLTCIVLPLFVTLHQHRPLVEALITAYPLLAAWQTLSTLMHLYFARQFRPWRSLIRVPYTVLQLMFMAAVLIHVHSAESFSRDAVLQHPAGQLLAATYFLLTYIEWERLSDHNPQESATLHGR